VGTVFEDLDGNGVQNVFAGEMGLAGWTVELHNPDGSVVTTTTDVDGAYMFSQLQDGSYAVCVPSVGGYVQTSPAQDASHPCGGWGWPFLVQGQFEMWGGSNFGEKMP